MSLAMFDNVVALGHNRASLDAIARPDAALAIWWRSLPDALRAALASLDLDTVDDVALDLAANEEVDGALADAGYVDWVATLLAEDIGVLVGRHAALTGEDRLRLRLEVIETDDSRRFHADIITLQLLCTYVGPGTQWCRADGADTVYEVPTGAVGVFKGRLLLDPPTILHCSPPIRATGGRRLVLAIDPLPDPPIA